MKKTMAFVLALLLMVPVFSCAAAESGGTVYAPRTAVEVASIFAAPDIQPYVESDGDQEMIDSVWVFYSDGTFEQFAEADGKVLLFSTGTYDLLDGADFVYETPGASNGQIVIRRDKKLSSDQVLADYSSEHTYDLGTLGFVQLYAPDPDRKVKAVFYGNDKQPWQEQDGDSEMLDTWWIYYADGTFDQFAVLDDQIVLFSLGTYQLSEGSSFIYEKSDTSGMITIRRTKKYLADGLAPYESSHEYELSTLGFVRIVAIGE